ncbi:MAG TPA: hypothetical protein VGF23_09445 [Gaiellaceae bacterium]
MESRPPLVVRWHALELDAVQAGAPQVATVELENAGAVTWRTRGAQDGIFLAYHWLDERGNPIVWDGQRTPLDTPIEPGERTRRRVEVRGPIPPGRYRLALDLVEEHRYWLSELGNALLERDVDVAPRDAAGARTFLPEGVEPDEDWLERIRGLHEEGFSAVGGAVDAPSSRLSRRDPALAPYAPGGGRNPTFPHPLVCPSLLPPLEPNDDVAGLPAWRPVDREPWLYDGRAVLRLRSRSGRPRA